eukprot:659500-Prorocentrum_minimum.AAC.1
MLEGVVASATVDKLRPLVNELVAGGNRVDGKGNDKLHPLVNNVDVKGNRMDGKGNDKLRPLVNELVAG